MTCVLTVPTGLPVEKGEVGRRRKGVAHLVDELAQGKQLPGSGALTLYLYTNPQQTVSTFFAPDHAGAGPASATQPQQGSYMPHQLER